MISRTKLLIVFIVLFGLGTLGCSGGMSSTGVTPALDESEMIASAQSSTSGSLVTWEGTAIPFADVYVDGGDDAFISGIL